MIRTQSNNEAVGTQAHCGGGSTTIVQTENYKYYQTIPGAINANDFKDWLRGFLDACGNDGLTSAQVNILRNKVLTVVNVLEYNFGTTIYPNMPSYSGRSVTIC
jgi:hypothetical protein